MWQISKKNTLCLFYNENCRLIRECSGNLYVKHLKIIKVQKGSENNKKTTNINSVLTSIIKMNPKVQNQPY